MPMISKDMESRDGIFAPSERGSAVNAEETTLLALLNAVLRRGLSVAVFALVTGVAAVLIAMAAFRQYAATSRFIPASPNPAASRLTSLASQFGVMIPGTENATETPEFYANLLKSREVLRDVVRTPYRVPEAGSLGAERNLIWYFGIRSSDSLRAMRDAIDALNHRISVGIDTRSGIVTLRTQASYPSLAEQINGRLLALVNEFNLSKRQSRAGAERAFIEQRLDNARGELAAAETALTLFFERNRGGLTAPQLRLEEERLQRVVDTKAQVVTTLSSSYEQARIDEVKNLSLITIIEGPEQSARRNRNLLAAALLGTALGAFLGLAWALIKEHAELQRRTNPAEFEEFLRLGRRLSPKRLLGRSRSHAAVR